ncbi:SulP family inorganic anion transporter [Porticoccus sp. W117]|uniref:SulP family inorganic anion transporter n=1 Tax=Porticoccus sp. W117 TaxID=3054777 RepID=UPI0025960D7B|nr:SulP family inorganic anion transporter [Porticoccus sp. W117]MDM3871874.1 SulP family inorganic anion transporter [Porticoccus sp. W117]
MKARRTYLRTKRSLFRGMDGLHEKLFPFLSWGQNISQNSLKADLMAGVTGAVLVLPQGVAYALIAGLPAVYGIYTAIVTPIIAGLFGSSRHLISGPTAAISIIVMKIASELAETGTEEFVAVALTLTFLCGLVQYGMGLARLGSMINFISHTVVLGFTAGASLLIATSQLRHFFGIDIPKQASVTETWMTLWNNLGGIGFYSVLIAFTTIVATLAIKQYKPRWPNMLSGMVIGSLVCWLISGDEHGIALVGALPRSLPTLSMPDLSEGTVAAVLPGAMAVAVLGLVEAVSIARAIGIRSGQRISGSREFIGQGLSNIVGSFFSCYAGSGSFTRSGANYDAGAQTPLAGVFAALILILVLLLIPDITAYLPMPVMAGTIILVAWNLIDFQHIKTVLKSDKQEITIFVVTFGSTLFVELEFAIYFGVILSLVMFLRRTSIPQLVVVAPRSHNAGTELRGTKRFGLKECPQLKIVRVDGSIFFGSVNHIVGRLQSLCNENTPEKHLMLLCTSVNTIDLAGMEMLIQEKKRLKDIGGNLYICGLKSSVRQDLTHMGGMEQLPTERFTATPDLALNSIVPMLEASICESCEKRVFKQCPQVVQEPEEDKSEEFKLTI